MLNPQPLRRPPTPWPVDLALLNVRIGLATVFMFHGAQKLFGWFGGHGLGGLIEAYGAVIGTLVGIGEFFGGLGLLVGLLSRFSAASLIVIMGGAIVLVHGKNGFASSDGGIEYNFVLITMALAILVAGPGRIALGLILPARLKPWLE
jgi:putative oxidoreductase